MIEIKNGLYLIVPRKLHTGPRGIPGAREVLAGPEDLSFRGPLRFRRNLRGRPSFPIPSESERRAKKKTETLVSRQNGRETGKLSQTSKFKGDFGHSPAVFSTC